MAFQDYYSELIGAVPALPPTLAQTFVNRAWKELRDLRLWSFLIGFNDIPTPVAISAGTASVVFNTNTVNVDSTAGPALNAVALSNPPLSGTIGVGRQFRLAPGPLYTITGWVYNSGPGTGVITLDRNFEGPTANNQAYQVYKAYYNPPVADFLRYIAVTNMSTAYTITNRSLLYSQSRLAEVDPQRTQQGDAYYLSQFTIPPTGNVVHEFYPHPTNGALYTTVYRRRGADLSATVDLPYSFPSDLLLNRAYNHSYRWALSNCGNIPQLANTNWMYLLEVNKKEYGERLIQCIKTDDEIITQLPFTQRLRPGIPVGGTYLQAHDVSSLVGGLGQ